ncbi:uncharacterized, partial [Tachysurus ichikawai]
MPPSETAVSQKPLRHCSGDLCCQLCRNSASGSASP